MVPAGRIRFLARMNSGASNQTEVPRSGLDKTERLGIGPLGQDILVKKVNGHRLTTSARAARRTLRHEPRHGTAHFGLWDVRIALIVATNTTLTGVVSATLACTRVRIGSVDAGRGLAISPTTVRPGRIRSISVRTRVHATRTNAALCVRRPKVYETGCWGFSYGSRCVGATADEGSGA